MVVQSFFGASSAQNVLEGMGFPTTGSGDLERGGVEAKSASSPTLFGGKEWYSGVDTHQQTWELCRLLSTHVGRNGMEVFGLAMAPFVVKSKAVLALPVPLIQLMVSCRCRSSTCARAASAGPNGDCIQQIRLQRPVMAQK